MNFIDWENEYEAILDAEPETNESPIYGMDIETFNAIMDDAFPDCEAKWGVKKEFYERFPIKEATKNSTESQCAVCIQNYKVGDQVFFLPCKHHFHINCIMPWFKSNHVCPNCRYDLNEGENDSDD